MPELPEIESIVRMLRTLVPDGRIQDAWIRHHGLYRKKSKSLRRLAGRRIGLIERVGKNAVFWLEPGGVLVVNLGMTGRLEVHDTRARPAAGSGHLHARVVFEDGVELRYYDARRFGRMYLAESCDFERDLNVGPDPFQVDAAELGRRLAGRRAAIKALLLDQRIVSGIGNIYADETLFYAKIDPRLAGDSAARRARVLLENARGVLQRAIAHGGSTLRDYRKPDGTRGSFQRLHAVYGREGEPCLRCKSAIRKIVIVGRGTHFCPKCQRK